MKSYRILCTVLSCLSLLFCENVLLAANADTTFRTGLDYGWWGSNKQDRGMQLYVPLEADAKHQDLSLQILGAYAYTYVNASDAPARSLSKFTDTKLNFAYEVVNKIPVDVLFGLGFNLPTGYTDLSRSQIVFIVPPELMDITTFGEGFNVNPTIIFSKEWTQWVAGIGFGYTWRGEYDYSFDLKDYNPGDIFNINAELGHDFSPDLYGRVFGQFLTYTEDKSHGEDIYQEGNASLVGLGARYRQQAWTLECSLQGIFRNKSKISTSSGAVAAESSNSHGDEFIGDFLYGYSLNSTTSLNTKLQLLLIEKNDYPSDSPVFIGERQKTTIGAGLTKQLRPDVKGSIDFEAFYMRDDKNIYHPDVNLNYRGFSVAGKIGMNL